MTLYLPGFDVLTFPFTFIYFCNTEPDVTGDETFIHSEYDVFYSWQNRYTERYNISDMLLNFFVRRGDTYERFEERHLQRAYTERELKVLLGRAGFENVKCFGELTFEPPKPEEQRLVFVCS